MALLKAGIAVVEERIVGSAVILGVAPELLEPSDNLLKEKIEAFVRKGYREVIIDLQRFEAMDSSDLGRLIRSHLAVRRAGGRIRLCRVPEHVVRLLSMTRLDTVFDIHQTENEALSEARSGGAADEAPAK